MIRELIKSEKKAEKHTNIVLAKHCGCSLPTISNFLSGKKGIKYEYLIKLIELYELRVIKIMG